MAQDLVIAGATYEDVPSILVPKNGGGVADFVDTSDGDATAEDILKDKTAYVNGEKVIGTYEGGSATLITKSITENGTYNASDDNADGYSSVTVAVGEYDMSVTTNQVKMIVEVTDEDKSLWTRFGQSANSTVTIDWGDGTTEVFTETKVRSLDYATQRKHNYQEAGKYLITETVTNGTMTIGSINAYSTLVEGDISPEYVNASTPTRQSYLLRLKALAFGSNITVKNGFCHIPQFSVLNDVDFIMQMSGTDYIKIKDGVTTIGSYWFSNTTAYKIKVPSSVTQINNNAFDTCAARIIDFTETQLDEDGNLPIVISATNVFRGNDSSFIVFATQEIAEVVKQSTNWSAYASRIKYLGELQ